MSKFQNTFLSILLLLIAAPMLAQAQTVLVTKAAPTSSPAIQVIAGDTTRVSVTIENNGSVNVGVGGSNVTYAGPGMVVAPSQYLKCVGNTDAMYAIAASSTADLRVIAVYSSGQRSNTTPFCEIGRLSTSGGAINTAAANTIGMSDGAGNIVPGNVIYKMLTTAITPNSTACTDASGSLAITSNATGLGTVFRCDGSNYQLLAKYSDYDVSANLGTIATTSTTVDYIIAASAATLTGVDFSGVDALTASDTNYITFTITNLGQAGSGTNPMLIATAASTTQATGGFSIVANTRKSLTLHATGSNLIVAKGDRLKILATVTGTLANTVTFSKFKLYFTRLS